MLLSAALRNAVAAAFIRPDPEMKWGDLITIIGCVALFAIALEGLCAVLPEPVKRTNEKLNGPREEPEVEELRRKGLL